MKAFEERPNGS